MRASALFAAMLLIAPGLAAAAPNTADAKLARALEGRVAGEPVDCIYLHQIRSSQIFDRIGILYETTNGTYYLNRPDSGASSLRWGDVLVTDTHSPQLCSIDVVRLYDSAAHMQNGFVGLGKFIPYARPPKARSE